MNAKRIQRMPKVIAFLRDRPNLAYSITEISNELNMPVNSLGGLAREAAKPASQIVSTGTKGFYMWTTTPQSPKEPAEEMPIEKLDKVGVTKDGNNVYKDVEGNLWTAIFERL